MLRWLPPCLLVVCALALASVALSYPGALNQSPAQGSLERGEQPYTEPAGVPEARPERVVLVVVDGLRHDIAQELPSLRALGERGVSGVCQAPQPSYSRPAYVSLVSGASPERHGVRTNRFDEPVAIDTVMLRVRDAGLKVEGVSNHPYWEASLGQQASRWETLAEDATLDAFGAAVEASLERRAALTVVHWVGVDEASHAHGGVSAEARQRAHAFDARLGQLLARVDLSRDAVIVVSDHGHLDRGGHGGDASEVRAVPLIAAGRGVAKGATVPEACGLASVAPTASLLLGVQYPRDMSAPPLIALLDRATLGASYLGAREGEWRAHRASYERKWLHKIYTLWTVQDWQGEDMGNNVSATAASAPERASLSALMETRSATLDAMARDRRVGRTPLAAVLLAVWGMLLAAGLLMGYRVAPLAVAPVQGGAALLIWWAQGLPLTFSSIATHSDFAMRVIVSAGAAAALYLIALEVVLRVSRHPHRREARRFHAAMSALGWATVPALIWILQGYSPVALPGATRLFAPMWLALCASGFAVCAALIWALDAARGPAQAAETPADDARDASHAPHAPEPAAGS